MASISAITSGTGKAELIGSLSLGDCKNRYVINFEVESSHSEFPKKGSYIIDSLAREDGSGAKWNFEGYALTDHGRKRVRGFYNSGSRKGIISLVD